MAAFIVAVKIWEKINPEEKDQFYIMTTLTQKQVYDKANQVYPMVGPDPPIAERNAYARGYLDAIADYTKMPQNYFEQIAEGLRKLWPAGNKKVIMRDGSVKEYAWRDSVSNLVKRLEFIWKDRQFRDKYSVDDCMMAARRYLAQYEENTKYMQLLKYFVFKQGNLVNKNGKATHTYESKFADMLESNPVIDSTVDYESLFETSNTFDQGELI